MRGRGKEIRKNEGTKEEKRGKGKEARRQKGKKGKLRTIASERLKKIVIKKGAKLKKYNSFFIIFLLQHCRYSIILHLIRMQQAP